MLGWEVTNAWHSNEALQQRTRTGSSLSSREFDELVNFKPLYRTDVEWAAELSNQTVHAIMHLAWVEHGPGLYRGQMGVYVKPRGRFGTAYMAAIAPFRHLIVYPALMREVELAWNARMALQPALDASPTR